MSVTTLAYVAAGGALGALARYGIGVALSGFGLHGAAGILLVNVLGCAAMGALVTRFPEAESGQRVFLGAGVLGGFTTFSAFAADAVVLGSRWGTAYLLGSVLLSLMAFHLGKLAAGFP